MSSTSPNSTPRIDGTLPRPRGVAAWLPQFMLGPLARPKVFQLFKPVPSYYRASVNTWCVGMHAGPLRRDFKEAIAVAVSIANQCPY